MQNKYHLAATTINILIFHSESEMYVLCFLHLFGDALELGPL